MREKSSPRERNYAILEGKGDGKMIETEILGIPLCFETGGSVFSPGGVDAGTLAMLAEAELKPGDKVLDLGCGYGPVGLYAAKRLGIGSVVLCDVSEEAVGYARANAAGNGLPGLDIRLSDGYSAVPEHDFTLILSNPPYHTDFSVAKRFIEGGFRRLALGGRMMMVTKRREWYQNKLAAVFGGVKTLERDGYWVFLAEKRREGAAPKRPKQPAGLSRKLRRRQERTKRA